MMGHLYNLGSLKERRTASEVMSLLLAGGKKNVSAQHLLCSAVNSVVSRTLLGGSSGLNSDTLDASSNGGRVQHPGLRA